jgi:hypothetical protein
MRLVETPELVSHAATPSRSWCFASKAIVEVTVSQPLGSFRQIVLA